jgi:hypothetical protein
MKDVRGMPRDYFVRYGGAAFLNNVAPEQIHNFVRQLPTEEKQSVHDVLHLLENQGYISKIDDASNMS